MMTPRATEPESNSAMMASVKSSVFSLSQSMAAATSRLKRTMGTVGSANPHQNPSATPARAEWETVSLKKAMRRAMTNTPSNAQSGARTSAASNARCMKGSVNMMMVVVFVRRDVDPVTLLQRVRVHDFLRRAFAADHAIQSEHVRGMAINHREIVRNKNDGQVAPLLDVRNEFVKGFFARRVHPGSGFIQ